MDLDKKIKEYMTFRFDFVTFFYTYCEAKGIDNPECDLTDDQYERLERECEKKITINLLSDLHEAIMADAMERILYAMD